MYLEVQDDFCATDIFPDTFVNFRFMIFAEVLMKGSTLNPCP